MSDPREGSSTSRISIWNRDLDHPNQFLPDISASGQMGGAGPSKPKKPRTANEKDPDHPPPRYTTFVYRMALQWYEEKNTQYLEKKYLRNKGPGIEKLKDDFLALITEKCNENAEYKDVQDAYHNQIHTWISNCQQACIFNTKRLMLELRPLVPRFPEGEAAREFCQKMDWWQDAAKRLSRQQTRSIGWLANALKAQLSKDGASCVIWISREAQVVVLTRYNNQGGYGKVRKVHIEGMDIIPRYVHFAGKVSKATKPCEARVDCSTEALACPLNHPAIIKFLIVHDYTMEAYTLWWNGGHLKNMIVLNNNVVSHAEWNQIKLVKELTREEVQIISLFRRHKVKLAWALVYITSLVHQAEVLHNDLSPQNVLFHFPGYSEDVINIGICDWGLASHIHEGYASHYAYRREEDKDRYFKGKWWVAPELFYMYSNEDLERSLEMMQATHKYTVKSDSFSIGKLAQLMKIGNGHDFDEDLFINVDTQRDFAMKLCELTEPDVEKRRTCAEVVDMLMSKPWLMKPPELVFQDSVV